MSFFFWFTQTFYKIEVRLKHRVGDFKETTIKLTKEFRTTFQQRWKLTFRSHFPFFLSIPLLSRLYHLFLSSFSPFVLVLQVTFKNFLSY
ncbi:hypothetical protein BpHYR1_003933 [Brachionus plicatilis]|uniref:Uncharacterized protein n=1 Tax=Brachionus plicatilis TaxID=10195 RepID=A0A3M7QA01_BRAPC|nr:hypothetical protein BpHYR1_003933 [Brachionus plicatilis]